jgi:ComF family protein
MGDGRKTTHSSFMNYTQTVYWEDFIDLILPRHCSGCSRMLVKGEPEICTSCRSKIALSSSFQNPHDNELMDRLKGRIPLSHAFYYTWFRKGGVMQSVLHGIKYSDRRQAGLLLGNWIGHEMRKRLQHLEFDYLVPVPMHASKLRSRGYNQSALISAGIAEVTDIPVCEMLDRKNAGTTQTRLGRWQRWQNSVQVYLANDLVVPSSKILLVDDVMTTGATAEACLEQLFQRGIQSAGIATVALTL